MKKRLMLLFCIVIALFCTPAFAATAITSVSLSGVPVPVAGKHPGDISAQGIKTETGAHYSVMEIAEWADERGMPLEDSFVFKSGETYIANILLKANSGYIFPLSKGESGISVTINGKKGFFDWGDEDSDIVNVWIKMKEGESSADSGDASPSAPSSPSSSSSSSSPSSSSPSSSSPAKTTPSGESSKTSKKANPMTVKVKNPATVKASKTKKVTIASKKVFVVSNPKGKVSFSKEGGAKALSISAGGRITVAKGAKKGTYTMRVCVTAAGNANYEPVMRVVTVKVKVNKK